MANSLSKNVIYIDATGDIAVANPSFITGILISPSSTAGGTIVISRDSSLGQKVIRIKLLDDQTRYIPFNTPIIIGSAVINVTTLTTITQANLYGVFA